MKGIRRIALGVVVLSAIAGNVFAQGYPMPYKQGATANVCPATVCPKTPNAPLYPYDAPLTRFVGRYVDSTLTRDYQAPLRTLRARALRYSPERGKLYMMLGSTFASYNFSEMVTSLTESGSHLKPVGVRREGLPPETYYAPHGSVYAEDKGSGWITPIRDGQDRLSDFDWDDRGYNYLAYSIFSWGIVTDGAGKMPLVKQVQPTKAQDSGASMILTIKAGNRYYVLIGSGGQDFGIWDVTNPASPTFVRQMAIEVNAWARTAFGGQQLVAIGADDNTVRIYRPEALVAGGAPDSSFPGTMRRTGISVEGSTFYVSTGAPGKTGYISILRGSTSAPSAYNEEKVTMDAGFYPIGVQVYNGMMATWSTKDVRLYRVLTAGSGLEAIPLNGYFANGYTTGTAGYALPDGYTSQANGAAVIRAGGKDYLIYAGNGLGEVYEIQSRDTVTVSQRTVGRRNPSSATRDNPVPYYSDPLEFSFGASAPTRVSINFDNAEATDNRIDVTTPISYTRQYQGVVPANPNAPAEISRTREVSVVAYGDATNSDSTSISMLVPSAAATLRSGTISTPLTAGMTAKAMFGDEILDASDGRIEGHYAAWDLGGTLSNRTPDTPLQLDSCGAKTLSLASHYTPYTVSGATITPTLPENRHFIRSLTGMSVEVRPFVAALGSPTRNADGSVTFTSATRFSSGVVGTGEVTYTWKLLPAVGETPILTQTGIAIISGAAADPDGKFTIPAAQLATGRRIVLEVATVAFNPAATGCSAPEYALSVTPAYTMRVPDPKITITGCDMLGSLTNCRVTASSLSGDMTGWTYTWKVDGTTVVNNSATASTFDPSAKFTTSKNYLIELVARNVMGEIAASATHFVDKSLCDGKPSNVSFTYSGTTSGCQFTGCTTLEPLLFTPSAWGYQFQECDRFAWTFGTAGSSNSKSPTFTFPANGSYIVKLVVTNDNGSATFSYTVTMGSGTPPPPPPPPPPTGGNCGAPTATGIFMKFTGATSGCGLSNPNCKTSENISFNVETFGYTVQTCDRFRWEYGDGGVSQTRSAVHAYAAAGTYPVKLIVSNTAGSVTKTATITVTGTAGGPGPTCSAIPARAMPDFGWLGAESGCSRNGGTCKAGESIKLNAAPFGYTLQDCDVVEWNFGDGTTGSGREVNHVFPLTAPAFDVTISIRNSVSTTPVSGKNTITFPGSGGAPAPTDAQIATETSSFTANTPIQFNGAAAGIRAETTWLWEFGDSTTSSAQNPTKTYAQPGTYTVKLTVKNGSHSSQWAITTKQVTVTAGKAFRFLIPAVIHVTVPNGGGTWLTDLQIYNPDPSFTPTKPLELTFESSFTASKKVQVDSSTYVKEDLMSLLTSADGTQGAIIISGVAANEQSVPQMWTRTYLQSSNGIGTFGQLVPAIRLDTQQSATTGARQYVLAGLKSDPVNQVGFRSNIGIVNPTGESVTVTMRVFENRDVLQVGPDQEITIGPYSLKQINGVQGPPDETFTVRFISESGAPVVAYASMVDNVSNDPIFIEALQDDSNTGAAYVSQILPGVGRLQSGNWKSDVTVYNPEGNGVQFDLVFYDASGAKLAEAKDVTLGGRKFLQTRDLISAGLLAPSITGNAYGTLRLETKTPSITRYPIVYARTYSDQAGNGTFGQGIPAFSAEKANVKQGKPAIIAGIRNQASVFKTNVGVVSTSNETSAVVVTLLDATTGQTLGQPISIGVAPHQSVAPFDVFAAAGVTTASRASVKFELLSGAPVWGFASIIDATTKDPEYVPAVPLR